MPPLRRVLLLSGCLFAAAFTSLSSPAVRVSGTVVSPTGEPVPYAMVTLQPLGASHFADQSGRFVFPSVARGRYRLQVRQVGYRPLDTAVVVAASDVELRLVVEPLLLRLDSIVVAVTGPCRRPGPPDSLVNREAFALLQQLRTSAARFQLLSDSFPFLYDFHRTVINRDASGAPITAPVQDTARYRSDVRRSYRPGEMVDWGRGSASGERVLRLPTLAHFSDSLFVWSHCWSIPAVPSGDSLVALSFRPGEGIVGADVEGTVYLDNTTYQLRELDLALTHVQQALPNAAAVTTVMRFREEYPGLVLPSEIIGTTRAAPVRSTMRRIWFITEEQRLLRVRWLRTPLR